MWAEAITRAESEWEEVSPRAETQAWLETAQLWLPR